jgi:thiol-disulfide isomerase/thioredoxin
MNNMLTRRLRIQKITPILLIALSLFYCPLLRADVETDLKAPSAAIPYSKNLLQALAASQKSGKPMIIAFYAVWCPHCRVMRDTILKNPEVIKLAQEFEWVAIDIDRNVSLVNTYEIKAVPQFQIFDQEGNVRGKIIGQSGPSEFRKQLSSLLDQIKTSGTLAHVQGPIRIESGERTEIVGSEDYYRAKAICFSKVGYGPLDLPSQSPFQALRLGLSPRTPSTLGRGQFEARFRATWVNLWAPEAPDFVFDYEQLQTNIGLVYGFSDTLQFELGIETRSRFGGGMDSFIQEFHDLFNIDQNGRDDVPRGDFTFDIGPSDGNPGFSLTGDDKGIYSTSLLFTLQHNVTCGTEKLPAIAYAFTLRTELKNEDLEGGSPLDIGAWLSASERFGTFYLYGTLGYTLFGRDDFRTVELRDDQLSALVAIEWRFKPRASLLIQYLVTEGVAKDLGDLTSPSHEITLGAKWEVVNGTVLEFGLIENVITLGNSPDFGIHFGITSRF